MQRLFLLRLPPCQVTHRDQASLFLYTTNKLNGDITPVKSVVGCPNRLLATLAGLQRHLFRLHQLLQCRQQLLLHEEFPRHRGLLLLTGTGDEEIAAVGPLLQHLLVACQAAGQGNVDREARSQLQRGCQHLLQAHGAVTCQHQA